MPIVFETERLRIEKGRKSHAGLLHRLWSHPQVMNNVGFPAGLGLSLDEVRDLLARDAGKLEFGRHLIVIKKKSGEAMGECLLRLPDEAGIAGTDVKLLPEYWGYKYGVEIKQGLLDYLFTHTDCNTVEASPNIENIASIKMQRAVGGRIVDEQVYKASAESAVPRTDVHAYIFHVTRGTWEVLRAERAWLAAHLIGDVAALDELMHPEYTIIKPDGQVVEKADALASYQSGERHWEMAQIRDLHVREYGESVVVLGIWCAKGENAGEAFNYAARYQSVWVKYEGQWRMVSDMSLPMAE